MCGGESATTNVSKSYRTTNTTHNTRTDTRNYDNRDFSDNRSFSSTDNSQDKRAVLSNALQIMDGFLVNVDPSDKVLQSTIMGWMQQTEQLFSARRFDSVQANKIVSQMISAAQDGTIAIKEQQFRQLESWQQQLAMGMDFASASLQAGERLIESAGQRQKSVTELVFDLAQTSMGGTSRGQIRLVAVTLIGAAALIYLQKGRHA